MLLMKIKLNLHWKYNNEVLSFFFFIFGEMPLAQKHQAQLYTHRDQSDDPDSPAQGN